MKQFAKFALVLAVFGALILTGCSGAFNPAAPRGEGLTINVSGGAGARTLSPTANFTKYVFSFEGPELGYHEDVTIAGNQSSTTVPLMNGEWVITATAYVNIGGAEYAAAQGAVNVTMPTASTNINLEASQQGANGYFSYSVGYPVDAEVEEAGLWIYLYGETEDDGRFIDLSEDYDSALEVSSGSIAIEPGYYVMAVRLSNEMQMAARSEIVHIYSNMETSASRNFSANDFSGVITLAGTLSVLLNGAAPVDLSLTVRLESGGYIDAPTLGSGGAWSSRFPEPSMDMIIEVAAEGSGRLAVVDITRVALGSPDLENIVIDIDINAAIGGEYRIGETLTLNGDGMASPSYQWRVGSSNIADAEALTYVIRGADAGRVMSCLINYAGDSVATVTGEEVRYTVNINKMSGGAIAADGVAFATIGAGTQPDESQIRTYGTNGQSIEVFYFVGFGTTSFNELHFSGVNLPVIEDGGAGSTNYAVRAADAVDGVIVIIASFNHSNLRRDPIRFKESGPITVTYGDFEYENIIIPRGQEGGYLGEGEITYSSSDPAIAPVDADTGVVTLRKAGTVTITAVKADDPDPDPEYGSATDSYTLVIERKPLHITGISVKDKQYDRATSAEFDGIPLPVIDPAERVGWEGVTDTVNVQNFSCSFPDWSVGAKKVNVTVNLAGPDAVNYIAVTDVEAAITPKLVTISGVGAAAKTYDGGKTATPTGTPNVVGRINPDSVSAEGEAEFEDADAGEGKTVAFINWVLTGADAGNYELESMPASVTATINKAIPPINWPAGMTLEYGQSLGYLPLNGYNNSAAGVTGSFTWRNPDDSTSAAGRTAGIQQHNATFTPSSELQKNYLTTNGVIPVRVSYSLIEFVRIPNTGDAPYTFLMGESGIAGAVPVHQVVLTSSFNMGKFAVTREQYRIVTGTNSGAAPVASGDDANKVPVETVSWYDAIAFCNRLSIANNLTPAYEVPRTGTTAANFADWGTDPSVWGSVPTANDARWNAARIVKNTTGYRLPTEAQWEFACRAGTNTMGYWGNEVTAAVLGQYAWYRSNSSNAIHEVGKKLPNAWGLYDMNGNVNEWCGDWYSADYYAVSNYSDPEGPESGATRVNRGGSWNNTESIMRSAYRSNYNPNDRSSSIGFRIVRP